MRLKPSSKQLNKSKNPQYRIGALCIFFLCFGIFLGWKNIPGFIKANLVLLGESRFLDALMEENNLDTIQLDISFKNLQRIEAKRQKAIQIGRLISSSEDFVNAKITHNGKTRRCKIRLKGDLPDHWTGDKFSLRVEVKEGDLVKGMSRFSLQDPLTRTDTEEWLFLKTLSKEKCMAVRYDFVNLNINGKKMGIYAMEEHFSKELIEANQRREGVIVKFDDYYIWKKHEPFLAENIEWNSVYRSSPPQIRDKKRVLSNESLSKQSENAINLLRGMQKENILASRILDKQKLGAFLAITHIWQAEHGLGIDDMNFFFNPITALLEPIGFGAEPSFYAHYCFFTSGDMDDSWVNYCLTDPLIASSYLKQLEIFSSQKYFEQLKEQLFSQELHFRKLLLCELLWEDPTTIWKNASKIFEYDPWINLQKRIKKVRNELSESRPLYAQFQILENNQSKIAVTLRNCTTYPLEIVSLEHLNEKVNLSDVISGKSQNISPTTNNIYLPPSKAGILHIKDDFNFILDTNKVFKDFNASRYFSVETKFLGTDFTQMHSTFFVDRIFFSHANIHLGRNKLELQNLPHTKDHQKKFITINPGEHKVDGNIFIPSGQTLIIHPNTTLKFSFNSTFVSEGNIIARGKISEPIYFTSDTKTSKWPGLLLFAKNQEHSFFDQVNFNNVSGIGTGPNKNGITRNGWTMTGGVTVYNSTTHFKNCSFENFETEDALNIISSEFSLDNVTFNNVSSDAFDGDFVKGIVSGCLFSEISGDGADFSGSDVHITHCKFKNISDKAISVGENSRAKISQSTIENVAFGIVSKDQSVTTVEKDTIVKNANIAAFSAFQKKPLFGPAFLKVENPVIVNCKQKYLIQNGSAALENTKKIGTEKFSSDSLYTE